jgi:hypothetical protein
MTTDGSTDHAGDRAGAPAACEGDREIARGRDLAHPSHLVDAAGDAPASQGPHGADRTGDPVPARSDPEAARGLGDADAPLAAAATGEQFDPDAPDVADGVTEHTATPRSWQRHTGTDG